MKEYFEKFKYGKVFERLPEQLDGLGERKIFGEVYSLYLGGTEVDMIPAGFETKGFNEIVVDFKKKPLFIAPDFKGKVTVNHSFMKAEEIEEAKDRYERYREWVELPRYIEAEDGTLSLCSLPKGIKIIRESFSTSWFLDLTQTDITEKQVFGKYHPAFNKVIVNPVRHSSLSEMPNPQKLAGHKRKLKTPVAGRHRD